VSKFDLKNSPKFKARVAKLEGNQYTKLLTDPVAITINERTYYVAAIGINDSYLLVEPFDPPFQWEGNLHVFSTFWTKSDGFQQSTELHENVQNVMLNWIMLESTDTSFRKVKHNEVRITDIAKQAMAIKKGIDYMKSLGPTFNAMVQAVPRLDIHNPYHS
jgi:hypothetical protein